MQSGRRSQRHAGRKSAAEIFIHLLQCCVCEILHLFVFVLKYNQYVVSNACDLIKALGSLCKDKLIRFWQSNEKFVFLNEKWQPLLDFDALWRENYELFSFQFYISLKAESPFSFLSCEIMDRYFKYQTSRWEQILIKKTKKTLIFKQKYNNPNDFIWWIKIQVCVENYFSLDWSVNVGLVFQVSPLHFRGELTCSSAPLLYFLEYKLLFLASLSRGATCTQERILCDLKKINLLVVSY